MCDSEYAIVLTTLPLSADATAFARTLVDERLAACVNVLGVMVSAYRWDGRVTEDGERQLIIKTRTNRLAALEARLAALHPYDTPEFLVLPVAGGSDRYLTWVRESTSV